MKRLFLLFTLLPTLAFADTPIHQAGNFGLGVGGGVWSSGLSGKYYIADGHAIQGVVGVWGLGRPGGDILGVTADYLLEMPALFEDEVLDINWSVGPGAMVMLGDNYLGFGATGALGLELNFNAVPVDFVLEYRPALLVVPDVYFDPIGFTGHLRYYF